MLTSVQIGILRDIANNKVTLEHDMSDWMRNQLVELVMNDGGPMLIDTMGPSVFLTEAGAAVLSAHNARMRESE